MRRSYSPQLAEINELSGANNNGPRVTKNKYIKMKEQSLFQKIFFSIYSYAIIYATFGALSLSYHACFNSSLSTLEKRYHFSSSTGGFIMIADNVAIVMSNLVIGHYGKTAHKPRWMSIGCLITGLSVIVTALPYFIYGPARDYDLEVVANMTIGAAKMKNTDQLCMIQSDPEDCSHMAAGRTMTMVAVICFAASNFFRGFGTSIYFTYGTPYLDDNVSKASMPTFFAFIFATRIFGAPIGFYLSSLALKMREDPFSQANNIDENDPRWVGAWWIGFVLLGTLMILLSIPISLFPREFRKKESSRNSPNAIELGETNCQNESDEIKQELNPRDPNGTPTGDGKLESIDLLEEGKVDDVKKNEKETIINQLPSEVWDVIKNPMIACQMIGNMFRGIGIIGYFVFQTRYLESQFRQSASKASLVSGTTGFLSKIIGILLGGLIITIFRPGPRVLTTYIFLVELTSVFTLLYGATVIGPQYQYPQTSINPINGQLDLTNQCNRDCYCDNIRYQPVCEHERMNAYYSPCHAGCRKSFNMIDGGQTFTECNCIEGPTKTLERCPPDTQKLLRYATIVAFGSMISGSSRSGNMVTFFRSISPEQKSMAVAVSSAWHSLAVSIPYPIIYGAIFDSCCLVWSRECNKRGNCWLYDTEKVRYLYHGLSISLIALGSVFDLIMIFLSPRLGNLYDKDSDGKLKALIGRVRNTFGGKSKKRNDSNQEDVDSQVERRRPHDQMIS